MLTGMDPTKPPQPSTNNDPDLQLESSRNFAAGVNSCPPAHVLEKHFSESQAEEMHPRVNALNEIRPKSSELLNINDSMSMHLLVETAIVDSAEYDVLSYEELEELKKQYNLLSNRIDASKRKLALESKVRDAALSMGRLYSKKNKHRKSLLGGVTEMAKYTDEELIASTRKCEELSQELWRLNNRAGDCQRRLLQHGAGILGMTHQGAIRQLGFGPPIVTSPGSVYTEASAGRIDEFDDRSLYRTPDKLDDIGTQQNKQLLAPGGLTVNGSGVVNGVNNVVPGDDQTAARLESLNNQLRNFLLQITSSQALPPPPHLAVNGNSKDMGVQDQLSILEEGIKFLQLNPPAPSTPQSSKQSVSRNSENKDATLLVLWNMLIMGEEEERAMKRYNGEVDVEQPNRSEEFSTSAFSTKVQNLFGRAAQLQAEKADLSSKLGTQNMPREWEVDNLSVELSKMETQLEAFAALVTERENDIIAASTKNMRLTDELQATKDQLAAAISELNLLRQNQTEDSRKEFSEEDNDIIKQKEDRIAELEEMLGEVKDAQNIAKAELEAISQETSTRIKSLEVSLETLSEALRLAEEGKNIAVAQEELAQAELSTKSKQLTKMDAEMRELETKFAALSTEVALLKAELDSAYGTRQQRAAETAQARAAALALEKANKGPQTIDADLLQEVDDLANNNRILMEELISLKTEKAMSADAIAAAEKRCKKLQMEMEGMLGDFEGLTKQSIEFEHERVKLEALVDSLRERCEVLEMSLADERVRWLGLRNEGSGGVGKRYGTGEGTGISLVKEEFKKMVRDMRNEQSRALRAEQEERRKLEGVIRGMKKELLQRKPVVPT
ncbi:hypothetical protein RUND412_004024 [Rhizina undulata]